MIGKQHGNKLWRIIQSAKKIPKIFNIRSLFDGPNKLWLIVQFKLYLTVSGIICLKIKLFDLQSNYLISDQFEQFYACI